MEGSIPLSVGARLREARRAVGLTQAQVAAKLGVSRRSVYEWEGDVRLPHSALPDLAALYGQTVTMLLYGVDPASEQMQTIMLAVTDTLTRLDTLDSQLGEVSSAIRELDRRVMVLVELLERTAGEMQAGREQIAEQRSEP